MKFHEIFHLGVVVRDLDEAVKIYTGELGYGPFELGDGAFFADKLINGEIGPGLPMKTATYRSGKIKVYVAANFLVYGTAGVMSLPLAANFSGEVQLFRPGSFAPQPVLPAHGFDHDSRGVGAAELAWALRLGREPRADASLGLHCLEILHGIDESCRTRGFYRLTTTCARPKPLPKGHRGLPGFCFSEESSLVL